MFALHCSVFSPKGCGVMPRWLWFAPLGGVLVAVAVLAFRQGLAVAQITETDVIETWIETKRANEIDFIRLRPHPGEFSLYFNV